MVTAAVGGANHGTVILWSVIAGAIIKFTLNEGIARWQLGSGSTLLEGWSDKLHPAILWFFLAFLILWSFIVGAALISACGLAAQAMVGQLSVSGWGTVHSLVAGAFVLIGRYLWFERVMKVFTALMFVLVIFCAAFLVPELPTLLSHSLVPRVPSGSTAFMVGIIGGIGGSLTILNYNYWIREKGWTGKTAKKKVSTDLTVAYTLTALFAMAIMIISAGVDAEAMEGKEMVLAVADRLGDTVGPYAATLFKLGFWAAVFSSMLGVWQGVPYMFADTVRLVRKREASEKATLSTSSTVYRIFLGFLTFVPLLVLIRDEPVWVIVLYTIIGGLFMPFIAVTLLHMNNRDAWVGRLRNQWWVNALLILGLLVFVYLFVQEVGGWW